MAERKVGKQDWGRGREKERGGGRGGGRTETHSLCKCNLLLCISVPPTDSDVAFLSVHSGKKNVGE